MADELVPIVHEDGRTGTVPKANLAEAQRLGWHPETKAETAEEHADTLPVAFGKAAVAGTVGAALALPKLATGLGSAALGVQDPLARFSGRQFVEDAAAVGAHLTGGESEVAARQEREALQGDALVHPYATTAGEIVGNVAGSGLLGVAGRGIGALVGHGAEALGLGARAATIASAAGASALEGAGLGATAASESAWLKDQQATAEQTLAGIGMGALFGGALGGVFGAAGSRGASLAEQLAPRVDAEGLEGTAARLEAEGAVAEAEGGAAAGERTAIMAPEEALQPAPVEQAATSSVGKRARQWLSDTGDEGLVDAIARGNKPALKDLGRGEPPTAVQKREVGALLHEMGIPGVGKSETDMLETAEQRLAEQGRKIEKVVRAADARVAEQGAEQLQPKSIEAVFPKIEALKTKLRGEGMLAEDRAIPAWLDDQTQWLRERASTGELMPSDIQKFRIEVDSRLGKWTRAEPGPKAEAARELRRTLEDFLEGEIRKTAPDLAADYTRAKQLYSAARWATDTLGERVGVRNGANRMASPTDYLTGLSTLFASHNPVLAAGAAVGNKMLRERGWSTAAVLAKKLAGEAVDVSAAPVAAVQTARNLQAVVAHTEQRVSQGVGRFFGGAEAAIPARAARRASVSTAAALRSSDLGEAQRAYRDHAREVQTVAAVPEVAQSRLAGITGQALPAVAPGLNAAIASVAARGAQYLAANMPAPPTDPDSITPQLDEPPPVSASDLARYADRVEGVENPLSLVDDLAHGNVSPDKTDAVKAVYPVIFERIRANVFAQLAELKTPVPYHQRLLLDLALDGNGALEPSLRPQSLAVMKAANAAAMQSAKPPSASGKVPHIAGIFATRTSQIAAPRGA